MNVSIVKEKGETSNASNLTVLKKVEEMSKVSFLIIYFDFTKFFIYLI
jgi:hypothetical protein